MTTEKIDPEVAAFVRKACAGGPVIERQGGTDMRIREGDIVAHFKGNTYKVLHMNVMNCDDEKLYVVYMALYSPYKIFVRRQDEFLSEVPDGRKGVSQRYRFETAATPQ